MNLKEPAIRVLSLDIGISTGLVVGECSPQALTILESSTLRVAGVQVHEAVRELSPIIQYIQWAAFEYEVRYVVFEPPLRQPNYTVSKVLQLVSETLTRTIDDLPYIFPERKRLIRPSQWKPVVPKTLDLYRELSSKFRPTIHERDASKILYYWWKTHPWTSA